MQSVNSLSSTPSLITSKHPYQKQHFRGVTPPRDSLNLTRNLNHNSAEKLTGLKGSWFYQNTIGRLSSSSFNTSTAVKKRTLIEPSPSGVVRDPIDARKEREGFGTNWRERTNARYMSKEDKKTVTPEE